MLSPESWHGQLNLVYTSNPDGTHGIMVRMQAPLKVQRPLYPEGPKVCHTILLHTAGGIVGGDRLSLGCQLGPQAQVLITTAAAAKVYGSRGRSQVHPDGLRVHQQVKVTLAPGSCLEWFPQETILFNGAVYQQHLRVDLAPGAVWCGWEITRLGRTAQGEQFCTGEWRSHTEVWQAGVPLWIDPQRLLPGDSHISSVHGLGDYPIVGSFVLLGLSVEATLVEQIRKLWPPGEPGEAGVTRLMGGLLCRYRGPSLTSARRWFIEAWHLLRPGYCGRSPCLPRVWPL